MAEDEKQSGQSAVISVLVVDHKPPLLNAIANMLRQTDGVRVLDAVLRPAQAVAETYAMAPDVVLYGFDARDEHCLNLLTQLRAKLRETYIIASSFEWERADNPEARAAGADDYVAGERLDVDLVPKVLRHERKGR